LTAQSGVGTQKNKLTGYEKGLVLKCCDKCRWCAEGFLLADCLRTV